MTAARGPARSTDALHERGLTIMVGLFMALQPLATDLYLASLPGLASRFDASPSTVSVMDLRSERISSSMFNACWLFLRCASAAMTSSRLSEPRAPSSAPAVSGAARSAGESLA